MTQMLSGSLPLLKHTEVALNPQHPTALGNKMASGFTAITLRSLRRLMSGEGALLEISEI